MQRIFVTNKRTDNVIIGVRLFSPAAQQTPRVLPVFQGPRQKKQIWGLDYQTSFPRSGVSLARISGLGNQLIYERGFYYVKGKPI